MATRRDFLKMTLGTAAVGALAGRLGLARNAGGTERPNVLWISLEDISPDLGCYGDDYAITPNIDRFAARGTRYDRCFAHMGVCAPARSGIITGMYPTHIGTNHMRCRGVPPAQVRCFTEYLRAAGYYCSNHSKADYQFGAPTTAWDQQGGSQWWRGRADGQPFFTVINLGATHESKIRSSKQREQAERELTPDERHDPAKAPVPPYHPDTPVVRRDWAQYYDNLTMTDKAVARILEALEDEGLADNTIVWFWGDHGRGLPRGKRWIYDSGSWAPLIIRVPQTWRAMASGGRPATLAPGTTCGDLVQFIDFGPTVLSLCGVPIPDDTMGVPFLGGQKAPARQVIYGARDRVDEANDLIRCVRDTRYKYIRNFMPHLPRSLDVAYMNQMPTMQEMRRLFAAGELTGAELQYFECPKPIEELYDTDTDPHEVTNLAGEAALAPTLRRLRQALFTWMADMGDFGLLPEAEFDQLKRPGDQYETTGAPGATPTPDRDGRVLVTLASRTEGASIDYRVGTGPAEIDGLVLEGLKATMNGPKPWPQKQPGNLAGWRNTRAWIRWEVTIPAAGETPVDVVWACGGNENSRYTVEIAGQTLEGVSSPTGGWDTFQARRLGTVTIPTPGKYSVTLKPEAKEGAFQMDLKALVLGAAEPVLPEEQTASRWRLYSQPVPLEPGQGLEARACRLGFRKSPTVRYRYGQPPLASAETTARPHWRKTVAAQGIVEKVLALKRLDGQGDTALNAYVRALGDPVASVRWWGVVGLHFGHDRRPVAPRTAAESAPYLERARALLTDPSLTVRTAAAHALCDWDHADEGLPVLVDVLQNHPVAAGRHLAATCLNQIGDTARPALEAIRAATKQGGYTRRMCQHLLERLGG